MSFVELAAECRQRIEREYRAAKLGSLPGWARVASPARLGWAVPLWWQR